MHAIVVDNVMRTLDRWK